jgi:hypothetical protein
MIQVNQIKRISSTVSVKAIARGTCSQCYFESDGRCLSLDPVVNGVRVFECRRDERDDHIGVHFILCEKKFLYGK